MQTNLTRHFLIFCLIDFLLTLIIGFIWSDSTSYAEKYANGLAIVFSVPILTTIMVSTIRTTSNINTLKVLTIVTLLVALNCISIILLNLINPFQRDISIEELKYGIEGTITIHLVFIFPICLLLNLIIILIKRRQKNRSMN